MARPYKYGERAVRVCLTLSQDVAAALESYANKSEYIDNLVRSDIQNSDLAKINAQLEELNAKRYELEKDLLANSKERNTLESQRNRVSERKTASMEERLKLVERFMQSRASKREIESWFESRTDALRTCDFATPAEAAEWVDKKMAG